MNPGRRGFLKAAAVLAPAVILTPGLLMKVRKPVLLSGQIGFIDGFRFIQTEPVFLPQMWASKLLSEYYNRNVLAELAGNIGHNP